MRTIEGLVRHLTTPEAFGDLCFDRTRQKVCFSMQIASVKVVPVRMELDTELRFGRRARA